MLKLPPDQKRRWEENLAIVREGMEKFAEAGLALLEIKEERQWRDDYPSWNAFCEDVLGESKTHADRRIRSAKKVEELKELIAGDAGGHDSK